MQYLPVPSAAGVPSIPAILEEFGVSIAAFEDPFIGQCCRVGASRVDDILWQVDVEYCLDENFPAVALTQTTRPINVRSASTDPSALLRNALRHFAVTFRSLANAPEDILIHPARVLVDGNHVQGIEATLGDLAGVAATLSSAVVIVGIASTEVNHALILSKHPARP